MHLVKRIKYIDKNPPANPNSTSSSLTSAKLGLLKKKQTPFCYIADLKTPSDSPRCIGSSSLTCEMICHPLIP